MSTNLSTDAAAPAPRRAAAPRRLLAGAALLLLAGVGTACSGDPTGPANGLFGVWELRTLNESTLPIQIAAFNDGRRVVLKSSTLRLLAEGAWGEISEVDSIFPGGRVRAVTLTRTGTWHALDRSRLQWGLGQLPDPVTVTVSLEGDSLILTQTPSLVLVRAAYSRQ